MKHVLLKSVLALLVWSVTSISHAQEGPQITMDDLIYKLPAGTVLTLRKEVLLNKGTDKVLLGTYCAQCMKSTLLCENKDHADLTFILVVSDVDDTKHRKIKKGTTFTVTDWERPRLNLEGPKVRYIQITNKKSIPLRIKHLTILFDFELKKTETEDF